MPTFCRTPEPGLVERADQSCGILIVLQCRGGLIRPPLSHRAILRRKCLKTRKNIAGISCDPEKEVPGCAHSPKLASLAPKFPLNRETTGNLGFQSRSRLHCQKFPESLQSSAPEFPAEENRESFEQNRDFGNHSREIVSVHLLHTWFCCQIPDLLGFMVF